MLPLLAAYMAASAGSSLAKGHGLSQVPIIGGFFSDPAQEDFEKALAQYGVAADARRGYLAEQNQNLMGQIQAAYKPAYGALAQLYNGHEVVPPTPPPQVGAGAPASVNAKASMLPPGMGNPTIRDSQVRPPRLPGFGGNYGH